MRYSVCTLLLLILPLITQAQVVNGMDKRMHFIGGAIGGLATYTVCRGQGEKPTNCYIYSLAAVAVMGIVKESIDDKFEMLDIGAGILGQTVIMLPIVNVDF